MQRVSSLVEIYSVVHFKPTEGLRIYMQSKTVKPLSQSWAFFS